MTAQDWNPVSVDQMLWELKERIAKGVLVVDKALEAFDDADEEFVIAEAKAYLGFDQFPAHERKYRVVLAVVDERKRRRIAERAWKKSMNNMQALRNGLEAMRSIGAGVREAYKTAGAGER
jgi:hypothetical protein